MPNSYLVKSTAISLKLVVKTKSTIFIWYITSIQKDQSCPNQNYHEFFFLSRRNTPDITYILKKLNLALSTIDLSKKKLYSSNPMNLTKLP